MVPRLRDCHCGAQDAHKPHFRYHFVVRSAERDSQNAQQSYQVLHTVQWKKTFTRLQVVQVGTSIMGKIGIHPVFLLANKDYKVSTVLRTT